MVERVNEELELMLPDLEFLQIHGLFSKREIRDIVEKRKAFGYVLIGRASTARDWTRAIDYEKELQAILDHRKPQFLSVGKRLNSIKTRIRKLFARAMQRFRRSPDKYKIFFREYILFLKTLEDSQTSISLRYARVVKEFPMDIDYWIEAAQWELLENRNAANARGLLQQALRLHPQNREVHLAYFAMELQHAQLLLMTVVKDLMCEVIISHLPHTVEKEDVYNLVAPHGKVRAVTIGAKQPYRVKDSLTRWKADHFMRTAVVRLPSLEARDEVIWKLNGTLVKFGKVKRRLLLKPHNPEENSSVVLDETADAEACLNIMKGAVALIVYSEAAETTLGEDIDAHFKFVEECQKLDYTTEVQTQLLRMIYHRFPNDERCLMRYISRKLHYYRNENASINILLKKKLRQKAQMDLIASKFGSVATTILAHLDKATQYLPGPRTLEESIKVVQLMLELATKKSEKEMLKEKLQEFERRALSQPDAPSPPAMQEVTDTNPDLDLEVHWMPVSPASKKRKLPTEMSNIKRPRTEALSVPFYLELLQKFGAEGQHSECLQLLERAQKEHPQDVIVWQECIKWVVRKEPTKAHDEIFQKAIASLAGNLDVAIIWQLYIQHKVLWSPLDNKGFEAICKLFQTAITRLLSITPPLDSPTGTHGKHAAINALCSQYIDYCLACGGPSSCKKVSSWLMQNTGLPMEVYYKLIVTQKAKKDFAMADVRALFESCLDQYGSHATDMWLQYIAFENAAGEFKRAQLLYERATKRLAAPKDFQLAYAKWKESQ